LVKGSIQLLLRHLLRQLNPYGISEIWKEIDKEIEISIRQIASRINNDPLDGIRTPLITLPTKMGGLGFLPHYPIALRTYKAAKMAAQPTLERIGFPGWNYDHDEIFTVQSVLETVNRTNFENV
jgi:hypothetical protein